MEGDVNEFGTKSGLRRLLDEKVLAGYFLSKCALPVEILLGIGKDLPAGKKIVVILLDLLNFLVFAVSSNLV